MKGITWIRNKTVVVTNADNKVARLLIYKLISKYNCKVLAISPDNDILEKIKEILTKYKDNLETYHMLNQNPKDFENLIFLLQEENVEVDCLINFAEGKLNEVDLDNINIKAIEKVFKQDFYTSIYAINYLMPMIKKSIAPGIINIVGLDTNFPLKDKSINGITKSALQSYTFQLSHRLGKRYYVAYMSYGEFKDIKKEYNNFIYESMITPVDGISDKILRSIVKKQRRVVIGKDARFYDRLSRFMPAKANKYIEKAYRWFKKKK